MGRQREAAATRVGRGRGVPGGERLAGRDRTGERVVLAVGAGGVIGVERPRQLAAGFDRDRHATAEGIAEHVVELVVDPLRLPLAVDRPDTTGGVVVVAGTLGDGALEAGAERIDEVAADQRPGAVERARLVERPAQRLVSLTPNSAAPAAAAAPSSSAIEST